jgi:hypothetical protein
MNDVARVSSGRPHTRKSLPTRAIEASRPSTRVRRALVVNRLLVPVSSGTSDGSTRYARQGDVSPLRNDDDKRGAPDREQVNRFGLRCAFP